MSKVRVELDHQGIGEIARSMKMQRLIEGLAERVAANVRAQGIKVGDRDGGPREIDLPVVVDSDVTDRARSVVKIKHPAGLAVQAKHGVLTKAAAAAGLQVRNEGS